MPHVASKPEFNVIYWRHTFYREHNPRPRSLPPLVIIFFFLKNSTRIVNLDSLAEYQLVMMCWNECSLDTTNIQRALSPLFMSLHVRLLRRDGGALVGLRNRKYGRTVIVMYVLVNPTGRLDSSAKSRPEEFISF